MTDICSFRQLKIVGLVVYGRLMDYRLNQCIGFTQLFILMFMAIPFFQIGEDVFSVLRAFTISDSLYRYAGRGPHPRAELHHHLLARGPRIQFHCIIPKLYSQWNVVLTFILL